MTRTASSELTDITRWDRVQCSVEWLKLTEAAVGRHLSVRFLRKALAFEVQCKEMGGHNSAVKQQLRGQATCSLGNDAATTAKPILTPGTQLVREWNGRIYRVLVTDDGFEMDGLPYRSLSAIAKRITGAGWSGPRFFGLSKAK